MKNNEELGQYLNELFPSATLVQGNQYPEMTVPPTQWHDIARKLRDNERAPFDYLISLTAVDFLEKFTIVAHLEATTTHEIIVLRADIEGREDPHIATVSDIWATAEFHEREVYDLFGIRFDGHPDLRRLFMQEGDGFPLRKDFKDEINIIELPN